MRRLLGVFPASSRKSTATQIAPHKRGELRVLRSHRLRRRQGYEDLHSARRLVRAFWASEQLPRPLYSPFVQMRLRLFPFGEASSESPDVRQTHPHQGYCRAVGGILDGGAKLHLRSFFYAANTRGSDDQRGSLVLCGVSSASRWLCHCGFAHVCVGRYCHVWHITSTQNSVFIVFLLSVCDMTVSVRRVLTHSSHDAHSALAQGHSAENVTQDTILF